MKRTLSLFLALMMALSLFAGLSIDAAEATPAAAGESYDLLLGTTRVTDANKDDILNDGGKARFDPHTNTLTLNDPVISDAYYENGFNYKIRCKMSDLTIKGRYHMQQSDVADNIYAVYMINGSLTLDGDFTFLGDTDGVYVGRDLTIVSGSVIVSTRQWNAVRVEGKATFKEDIEYLELQSSASAALQAKGGVDLSDKLFVAEPKGGDISSETFKHVIIRYNTRYDLWLGDTQVTESNRDNILGDSRADFDAETNTLTLKNPQITGSHDVDPGGAKSAKIAAAMPLTVNGVYHISDSDTAYGVAVKDNDLTLNGNFTFKGTKAAVSTDGDLVLENGTVNAIGGELGLNVGKKLIIRDALKKLDASGSSATCGAVCINMDYELGSGINVTVPEGGSFKRISGSKIAIVESDGSTPAAHAVVEGRQKLRLEGKGNSSAPYLIGSTSDWDELAGFVLNGGVTANTSFLLTDDISVSDTIGSADSPFGGVFDGAEHTLTLNIRSDSSGAPFRCISGATIKNLKTTGRVEAGIHSSGLVGACGSDDNLIENCIVGAAITCTATHCGGIIGHGGSKAVTTLKNCFFTGSVTGADNVGTLWGWSDEGCTPMIINCMDASDTDYPIGVGKPQPTLSNVYYTHNGKETGPNRQWSNGGKRAYTLTGSGVTLKLNSAPGLVFEDKIYAAEQESLSLSVDDQSAALSADAGTLCQNGSDLLLTMPAGNVTVSPARLVHYKGCKDISATAGYQNETAENLFDCDPDTKWCGKGNPFPVSVTFKTSEPVNAVGYLLTTCSDTEKYPGRNPVSWTLEGSSNGTDWVVLTDTSDNGTLKAKNSTTYAFSLTTPAGRELSYYRFTIRGISSGSTFQLSELQLLVTEKNYNLWVGNTRVTSLNCYDIFGDGRAVYDHPTHTLTLNDPEIPGAFKHSSGFTYKILSDDGELNLKGRYHMSGIQSMVGIGTFSGPLTVNGDFTFTGQYEGVEVSAGLNIESGHFYIHSTEWYGAAVYEGNFYVGDDVMIFDSVCDRGNAVYVRGGTFSFSDRLEAAIPENGEYIAVRTHRVLLERAQYDLWLGSTQVTRRNRNDILSDGGKAQYDPNTETLTLDEPVISGVHTDGTDATSKICSMNSVTITGACHMTSGDAEYGLRVFGDQTTLDGDFAFTAEKYGVDCLDLAIISGSLTAKAGLCGVNARNITIDNSVSLFDAEATAEGGKAVSAASLTFGEDMIIAVPKNGMTAPLDNDRMTVTESDGTTAAARALIVQTHTVSFDLNGHGAAIALMRVGDGMAADKPADPRETGYTFGGWFTDKECVYPYDFTKGVTEDLTLYAKWTINIYTITVIADNGTDAQYTLQAAYNEEFTLPVCIFAAPENKVFKQWDKGLAGDKIIITGDTVIKAIWRDAYRLGDVDCDGFVTILDATYIQRKLAGLPNEMGFNDEAADADEDGSLSILDATFIQRWLAGLHSNDRIGKQII